MPPSLQSLRPPQLKVTGSSPVPGSPIPGLMQHHDLLIIDLLARASSLYPNVEVISRLSELPATAPSHRTTYSHIYSRVQQLANVLVHRLHVHMGHVVATLAFNSHRHMELYFAVSGIGAILHTLNPRLFVEQLLYIIQHAEDSLIFVDAACVPLIQRLLATGQLPTTRFIVLTDEAHMASNPLNALCYETLLSAEHPHFTFPRFDEHAASSLCYTSGTTGNPKGVLYTHRSTVLHSMAFSMNGALGFSDRDTVFLVVPLFHVNGWGVVYSAPMLGMKLVLPGMWLDGDSVCKMMREEHCTVALGVPTVWMAMFRYLDEHPDKSPKELKRIVIGGSAPPRSMMERIETMGMQPINAYGMTEGSPGMSVCQLRPSHDSLPPSDQMSLRLKQGRALPLLEFKLTDDAGQTLPHDGQASGEFHVRGPWITSGYFKVNAQGKDAQTWSDQCNVCPEQFFATGDVSSIDGEGYMQIVDRRKDVIKSGGEWVSSIDLENVAMGHEAVAEAAVIGVQHSKWQERPLLICVLKKGKKATEAEVLDYLRGKVAKWWVPEGVEFVEELPHTATGKLLKTELRKQFASYRFHSDTDAGDRSKQEKKLSSKL